MAIAKVYEQHNNLKTAIYSVAATASKDFITPRDSIAPRNSIANKDRGHTELTIYDLYKVMSMQAGLFQLGMIDYHAILGFSLTAEPSQVRKRYLRIARQLHPDSLREATVAQRQLASRLLSKRVNPAYEALSKDKPLREHQILLKMKQQQLMESPDLVSFSSDRACKLLESNTLEADYAAAIEQTASTQFDTLDLVESVINELSELNAAYLIRTETLKRGTQNSPIGSKLATTVSETAVSKASQTKVRPVSGQPHRTFIIYSYIRRAKEFEARGDYSRGILELREAIGSHPKSAPCHAYLSHLYLRSGQAKMARIHAKQALAIEPENQTAQTVQDKLSASDHPSRKQTASRKGNADVKAQNKGAKKGKQGGGLLLGLFGGKKK